MSWVRDFIMNFCQIYCERSDGSVIHWPLFFSHPLTPLLCPWGVLPQYWVFNIKLQECASKMLTTAILLMLAYKGKCRVLTPHQLNMAIQLYSIFCSLYSCRLIALTPIFWHIIVNWLRLNMEYPDSGVILKCKIGLLQSFQTILWSIYSFELDFACS